MCVTQGTRLRTRACSLCQPGGPAASGALTAAGSLATDIEILAFFTPSLLQLTLVGVGHTIRATHLPGQGGEPLRHRQAGCLSMGCPVLPREHAGRPPHQGEERKGARAAANSPELLSVLTGLRGTARQVKSHTQRSSSASSSHQPPYCRHRSCSHSLPSPEPEPPEPHSGAKEDHGEKGLTGSRVELGDSRGTGPKPPPSLTKCCAPDRGSPSKSH